MNLMKAYLQRLNPLSTTEKGKDAADTEVVVNDEFDNAMEKLKVNTIAYFNKIKKE